MLNISFAGVILAVVAVFLAYYMGFANGVAIGRDEGFHDGRRDGKREGSIRAYAVGFDRGKRARDEDEDDEEDEEEEIGHGDGAPPNLGFAIVAVAAGLFAVLWLSSNTPTTVDKDRSSGAQLPAVAATDMLEVSRPINVDSQTLRALAPTPMTPQPLAAPTHSPDPKDESTLPQAVVLPRINRVLPSATPQPHQVPPYTYRTPAELEDGHGYDNGTYPHPPPAFRER